MLKAALAYVGLIFFAGFLLGTVRVLLIAPRLGATLAVALEVPLMLTISWIVSRWLVRRFAVPADWRSRARLGVLAFALLMGVELSFAMLVFKQSLEAYVSTYATAAGLIGLAAQAGFALMPLIQLGADRPMSFGSPRS